MVSLDSKNIPFGNSTNRLANTGSVGGIFTKNGEVFVKKDEEGIKAIKFVKGALTLGNVSVPKTLAWNGSYTVATWVKNTKVGNEGECLASWCDRHQFELANSYNALFYNSGPYGAGAHLDGHFDMRYKKVPAENKWHYIVLTFDGVVEKIYVDGVLDNSQNMILSSAIDEAKIIVGASDVGENYSGYMASLRMYDYALTEQEITRLMSDTNPKTIKK